MEPVAAPVREEADERLMKRVQADSAEAFTLLYDRCSRQAFQVAYSVCHDRCCTEEAVQEAFLSIWRGRSSYSPRPGRPFRAWAMQTVRNRAIDQVRSGRAAKRPRLAEAEIRDLPDPSLGSPHAEAISRDESRSLRRLQQQLPDSQAEVIALAFFGELSHTEIAAQLELPEGTVKGRMRLGLEKLRRGINGAGG